MKTSSRRSGVVASPYKATVQIAPLAHASRSAAVGGR
jgi:hypothetical protein